MKKDSVLSFLRHTLTFVGGLIVMRGDADPGLVTEATGAIIAAVGAIWGIVDEHRAAK